MQTDAPAAPAGYPPHEIRTGEPTRSARLKWVVVVEETLPAGRAVNAAVCVAAATGQAVPGLLGPDAKDAAGECHPGPAIRGLPWAGCAILAASSSQLAAIRSNAAAGVLVANMPSLAQATRVHDEYLEQVSTTGTGQLSYYAVSVVGPRNTIDKMAGKLALLT